MISIRARAVIMNFVRREPDQHKVARYLASLPAMTSMNKIASGFGGRFHAAQTAAQVLLKLAA